MKKFAALFFSLSLLISCGKAVSDDPMFWTWLEDLPDIDMESAFTHMEEAGIDAVMLHAPSVEAYQKDIEIARSHGIRVWAWVWTLNPPRQERPSMLAEHPEWFSVNRRGESLADFKAYVNSYKFLCPALPEVRDYQEKKIETICSIDGIEGVCLDYCRLVDVVLPISLSYNYNLRQDGEVFPEYDFGYHPAMIEKFSAAYGYDPRNQEDPSRDENWNTFRKNQITECANLMAAKAHSMGKKVTASPFATHGLASFMVFQEFGKWDLDFVHPMLYCHFYTMDPEFAYDGCVENNRDKNPATKLMCGLDVELGGAPESIFQKMDAAFRGGAQGISLYTIEGLDTPELRASFRHYSDSLRALKAANGGVVPFHPAEKADLDPFPHDSMMAVVRRNMQRMIAGEAIHVKSVNGMVPDDSSKVYPALDLGPFTFVSGNDRISRYSVTDNASGRAFEFIVVHYGGIVSGWDLR